MANALRVCAPPSGVLRGTLRPPGSKSVTNRLLIVLAQLLPQTGEPLVLANASDSDDSAVLIPLLRHLGVTVTVVPGGDWRLTCHEPLPATPEVTLDLGLAGTAARFALALTATRPGTWHLRGQPRLQERPLKPLADALLQAGARIESLGVNGHLPLRVTGVPPGALGPLVLDAGASSQFLSALLLLGPGLPVGAEIRLLGPVASAGYVELTLTALGRFGKFWQAVPGGYRRVATPVQVPGTLPVGADWSAASYLLAHAACCPAELTLTGLDPADGQPDAAQLERYRHWGLAFGWPQPTTLAVHQPTPLALPGGVLDCAATPDLAQTYAVLATQARGPVTLTGLHTLRHKETDRIAALATELASLGILTDSGPDWLRVHPGPIKPTRPIGTYHDHRMAMAFSLLAHAVPDGIVIEDPEVVGKSYPRFWADLASLGMSVTQL